MRVVVVTPPVPVVSLSEAKAHLRLDGNDEDTLVQAYIAAASAHIDGPAGWLGRSIGVQTLEARLDVFYDAMRLPYGPVIDIVSVKHLDAAGGEQTVLPSEYEVRGHLIGSAFGRRWPLVAARPEAVRIQYRAGYEQVPAPIRAAVLLMVGDFYHNRGAQPSEPSAAVAALLRPFRVFA